MMVVVAAAAAAAAKDEFPKGMELSRKNGNEVDSVCMCLCVCLPVCLSVWNKNVSLDV